MLFFSGRPSASSPISRQVFADAMLSSYYPFQCGNTVVGTITGTPRPPAVTGLRPAYQSVVLLDDAVGDPLISQVAVDALEHVLAQDPRRGPDTRYCLTSYQCWMTIIQR